MMGRDKTGDELLKIVKEDISYAQTTYGVKIISVVTDDGPDGKKMRRLIKADCDLGLATFECWAHQASLITGNYLSIQEEWMKASFGAHDIIKWFNNHSKALALLQKHQTDVSGHPLALLLPVPMRWTSQFTSMHRLLTQKDIINGCVSTYRPTLILAGGNRREQIEKASEIIELCRDDSFWLNLERYEYSTSH